MTWSWSKVLNLNHGLKFIPELICPHQYELGTGIPKRPTKFVESDSTGLAWTGTRLVWIVLKINSTKNIKIELISKYLLL